ncbi:hypothetical protein [Acinetobacter sp. WZC-1]|uniref:hypothetical protein n=1 Tax=Acinetobacter sp. WZC-1 TaxID=3459034 RepID=UPI00403DBD82
MKKLLILSVVLMVVGCTAKKPATPEEQWKGYCTSIGNAARSITLDRQNGISHKEALEYASKVTDPTTKGLIIAQLEKIYALPEDQLKSDKDAVQAKFKQEAYTVCVNTPHDPAHMPDYKPF